MTTAPAVQITASENPLCFTPEAGMAPCCLDPARTLATTGAEPVGELQSSGRRPRGAVEASRKFGQEGCGRSKDKVCLSKSRLLNLLFP